jgi:hypothetical protein
MKEDNLQYFWQSAPYVAYYLKLKFAVPWLASHLLIHYVLHSLCWRLTVLIEVFVILLSHIKMLGQVFTIGQDHFLVRCKLLICYTRKLILFGITQVS